jgi:hypothetical protein
MTISEVLFESFCKERGIECRRVETTETRTPDYEIRLASGPAAVEVKQLEAGTDDMSLLNNVRHGRAVSHWVNMGRPREALLDGARQLRAYARGIMPGIVVLFDTAGGLLGYLGGDSMGHSMYGPRQVHFAYGKNGEAEVVGASLGGGRVATESHNTTLSAAGVLRLFQDGRMSLAMFHNCFAALPVNPGEFRVPDVEHFIWATEGEDAPPRWTKV